MRKPLVVVAAVVATVTSGTALADLGPLPGMKRVSFAFSVQNTSAFPDKVLLAYPCVPAEKNDGRRFVKIEERKAVTLTKFGGECALYAMPKADFDQWAAAHKAGAAGDDEAVASLFKTKATACKGGPSAMTTIEVADPRSAIHEKVSIKQIDATKCELAVDPATAAAPPPAPRPSAAPTATAVPPAAAAPPTSSAAPAPAATPAQEPPPAKSGCGSCEVGGPTGNGAALAGLGLAGLLWRRRRRLA